MAGWGSTSKSDFFNKLDLRHFTFTYHGKDSTKPYPPGSYKLGANPQKDVFVSFGKLSSQTQVTPSINVKYNSGFINLGAYALVTIYNPGPVALYSQKAQVLFDDKTKQSVDVDFLPPYTSFEFKVPVESSFLGSKTPNGIEVKFLTSSKKISTNKNNMLIAELVVLFTIIAVLIVLILVQQKRIDVISIWKKITNLRKKH